MYVATSIVCFCLAAEMSSTYGGVPEVIFKLSKLQKLNLSYQAIKKTSEHFQSLAELTELNLSHNPQLESLCGEISLLKKLTGKVFKCEPFHSINKTPCTYSH